MNKIAKPTFYHILVLITSLFIINGSVVYAVGNDTDGIYKDAGSFEGTVGIYAKNLNTGRMIKYQSELVFPMASTSKLIVSMAVYKYMYPHASEESKERYDEYIKAMIEVSDNEALEELLDEISETHPNVLKQVISDLNLKQTRFHDEDAFEIYGYHNVTTAREMAVVMEHLVSMKYLDERKTELLKHELANTIYNDELPRYIRSKVMHKVGQIDQLNCDVGVVDDGTNQIVISIFTSDTHDDDRASDFIATISYKVYKSLCE